MADAARAAHALHEAGIVHNDIKPGNVLLDNGGAKLSDLSLEPVADAGPDDQRDRVRRIGRVPRSGRHPRRDAGPGPDIFALGATLHRALTGAGLYGDLPTDNTMLAMRQVLERQAEISLDLPAGIRDVIASAIDPDQAKRPATADDLADSIDALPADLG